MSNTNIELTDLTNTTEVANGVSNGTGTFDKLMNSVNLYLDDQYENGRLKGTDYANVLLGSIQTVLAQSVQYTLQERLLEAQVDDVRKGIEVKDQQIANMVDELLTTAKQRLDIDKGIEIKEAQKSNLVAEGLNIPKQGLLLDEELETSNKQQLILDEELSLKVEQIKNSYTERVIKDKQAAELGLDEVVKNANMSPQAVYTPKYEG